MNEGFVFFVLLQMVSAIMQFGCFNAAQWIFAFEYFCSAISIPYIFDQTEQPAYITERMNLVFWTVMAINQISPILYAVELGYGNIWSFNRGGTVMPGNWFTVTYLSTKYTIGFEQLVSGVVVIIAVIFIRKFLIFHGMKNQVDYKKLAFQSGVFIIYILSIVIFYYYLALQMTEDDPSTVRSVLIAWIVTIYMNFLVQLAMLVIFLQLKTHKSA